MRELLETISRGCERLTVRSDDHRAYPRAMRGLGCRITQRITSSKQRRDARNPLWEVNLLDLMIRHSTAARAFVGGEVDYAGIISLRNPVTVRQALIIAVSKTAMIGLAAWQVRSAEITLGDAF